MRFFAAFYLPSLFIFPKSKVAATQEREMDAAASFELNNAYKYVIIERVLELPAATIIKRKRAINIANRQIL